MVLADAKASHDPIPGYSPSTMSPIVETEMVDEERIYRLTAQRRLRTGKVALTDYDYLKPNTDISAQAEGQRRLCARQHGIFRLSGAVHRDRATARSSRSVRLEAEQAMDNRRYASGDVVNIVPGGLFTLERHPTASENTQYLVVRATHTSSRRATGLRKASPERPGHLFREL